jgi:hypothetical protein
MDWRPPMTERLDAAPERLSYDSARALFERNYRLLNEHDIRHIPTIFTEDIEFEDDAWPESIRGACGNGALPDGAVARGARLSL